LSSQKFWCLTLLGVAISPEDLKSTAELFHSLGHPIRVRVVLALETETLSPRELAALLSAGLGSVAYHVRALRDDGLVELAEQRHARGSLESFYRLSVRGRWAREVIRAASRDLPKAARR
jgi:DNA-binding transcriptional ArsR family regulator